MHFHYLQLCQALQTQFCDTSPNLEQLYILDLILGSESQKRISTFYNSLLLPSATALAYQLKDCWAGDVREMEDKEWEEVLDACKKVSPELSDRLTQLYILHKSYLTHPRMAKYRPNYSPLCPRCGGSVGTFFTLYGPAL